MKSIEINLRNPCKESWSNMEVSENGKFCSLCNKVVVDFTKMTDNEIYEFAKKNSNISVCGKIYKNQLNRKLIPQKKYYNSFRLFLISLLSLKLFNSEANERIEKIEPFIKEQKKYQTHKMVSSNSKLDNDEIWQIKGRIIDEKSKKPIAGLIIKSSNNTQTVTDNKGNFTIALNPEKHSQYRQISVDVPDGYTPSGYLLKKYTKKRIIIKIHETRPEELGGLGFSIEKSIWKKLFS